MLVSKLKDFSGYTSIHGIGRIGDSTFIIKKLFWICICLGSFSMCIFQIYRLILQFTSDSVITNLSTSYSSLTFPSVTFCNMNPLSYAKAKKNINFYQVVNETANALKYDISEFQSDVTPTTEQPLDNYTAGDTPIKKAIEMLHLRMGELSDDEVFKLNAPLDVLLVSCAYQGYDCNRTSEIKKYRDEYYGACYNFTPEVPQTNLAGPSFALELLLDVSQHDYIPFVTESSGVRLAIHKSEFKPILTSEGMSVSTAFETNIALKKKSVKRYPGSDGSRCDENSTFSGILPCMEACIGFEVTRQCKCLSSWLYKIQDGTDMCLTESQLACEYRVEETATETIKCDCKVPCEQTTFETDVFMTQFPATNYGFVLEQEMNTSSAQMGDLSKSLVRIKIFFASLTEDIIEESLAYTPENFVSDIGGQLGLWAGFSVISLAELLELVIILCHACCGPKKVETEAYKE